MILLHIISHNHNQANEIVEFLVKEHLIVDALIQGCISTKSLEVNQAIETQPVTLVLGKTKSMLFETIENALREKYGNQMPELYSLPIVNMNWEKAQELVDKTANHF